MTTGVTSARHGAIAVITVDNPPVNALSSDVKTGLLVALAAAAADPTILGIVIAASGRTFIGGADLKEMDAPPQPPLLPDVIAAIDGVGKPTAAALHGSVLGGGLEVALACRLRVMRAGGVVGFPEVQVGLVPGASGTQRLLRYVDFATAARMITGGKPVPAADALALGLVDRLAPAPDDDPAAARAPTEEAIALLEAGIVAGTFPDATVQRAASRPPDGDAMNALVAEIRKSARGRRAPIDALELLVKTQHLSFAEGLAAERALFLRLRESDESRSLRRLFFAERAAGRALLAKSAEPSLQYVGVVGAGLMGAGITYATLVSGRHVTVIETGPEALEQGRTRIDDLIRAGVAAGRLTSAQAAAMTTRLQFSLEFEALANADLVIEAVFESLEVKHQVFRTLDRVTRDACFLASNTSYLDLDRIAAVVSDPSRVLGLHFFSPAHVMRLVEVVRGEKTRADAIVAGVSLARALRKIPVVTGNCEGFCGNRILRAYRLEAEAMVEDGAAPQDIDRAMVNFGFPMGPFAVQDMAGLAIAYANRKLNPPILPSGRKVGLVERLVEAGRTGRKAGRGWYDYPEGAREGMPSAETDRLIALHRTEQRIVQGAPQSTEAIEKHLLAAIRREAGAIVEEGIVESIGDVALVMVHGYGFPAHRIRQIEQAETA